MASTKPSHISIYEGEKLKYPPFRNDIILYFDSLTGTVKGVGSILLFHERLIDELLTLKARVEKKLKPSKDPQVISDRFHKRKLDIERLENTIQDRNNACIRMTSDLKS